MPLSKRRKQASEALSSRWKAAASRAEIEKNIEKLKCRKGRFITKEETVEFLTCYWRFYEQDFRHDPAVKKTAEHLPVSEKSFRLYRDQLENVWRHPGCASQ